jgi:mannonate dehydratase
VRLATSGDSDEDLKFAVQLGATEVVGGNDLPTDQGYYTVEDMVRLRKRVEEAGLKLAVISELPEELTYKIKLGLPGRDEQIDNWRKTLRNMGEAGIDTMLYFFSLRSWYGNHGLRTDRTMPGRGGSKLTGFDYADIKDETRKYWSVPVPESVKADDEQIWDNITYFLKAVVPVAEEAGVRMGLHPDDPPISPIGGVARVFRSHAALRRLIEIVASDSNGLTFCAGTISEMPENVLDAIRYFGSRDKIFHVHFRSVTGTVPKFSETFIGEGHVDMMEAMKAFHEVGFDGPIVDDHVPDLVEGSRKQYRSHAYAMGYIRALIDVVSGVR